MEASFKDFFKRIESEVDDKNLRMPIQVQHPFIAEGYSDLLEDTEWITYG